MTAWGKFLLFAAAVTGLLTLAGMATRPIHLKSIGAQALEGNLSVAAAALLATGVFALFEPAGFLAFGLGGRGKARHFLLGLGVGTGLLAALLAVIRLTTEFRFGAMAFRGAESLHYGLLYAALFLAVALSEETLWRGYALVTLSQGTSFWPATIILSGIFAASHLKHAAENPLGILFAGLFGVVLAWSFLRLGSLWFALGIHASWDYAQSYLFGVPDSGTILPGALFHPKIAGNVWLTGGTAGPEGSVLMPLVLIAVVLIVRRLPRPDASPGM